MSEEQPHDWLFKEIFSVPEHAASHLRFVLPAELVMRIDWDSLALENTRLYISAWACGRTDPRSGREVREGLGQPPRACAAPAWYIAPAMPKPLTADEILPLVACLSPQEKARLLRLITTPASPDAAYRSTPPAPNEFASDEDQLAWDADGWENVG